MNGKISSKTLFCVCVCVTLEFLQISRMVHVCHHKCILPKSFASRVKQLLFSSGIFFELMCISAFVPAEKV